MVNYGLHMRGASALSCIRAGTVSLQRRPCSGGTARFAAAGYVSACFLMFCGLPSCPAHALVQGGRLWRAFAKVDRVPAGAPRYHALRRRVAYIPPRAVAAWLTGFHPGVRINFLARHLVLQREICSRKMGALAEENM